MERYIVINKEIFFDVLNILDEFSLAYQENWLKTEGINGFKFKLLMEYPLYMMDSLYNDFKTYEDCEKFSSDLLEGALKLSEGKFAIKFHRLVAYLDDKLFDFISNKHYKYSWKIMIKMYIFLLQSLLVKSNSDFAWRTAHLYQVRE